MEPYAINSQNTGMSPFQIFLFVLFAVAIVGLIAETFSSVKKTTPTNDDLMLDTPEGRIVETEKLSKNEK